MEETAYGLMLQITDLVNDAETRALSGNRVSALFLIQQADELYQEFVDILCPFPEVLTTGIRIATIANQLCSECHNAE